MEKLKLEKSFREYVKDVFGEKSLKEFAGSELEGLCVSFLLKQFLLKRSEIMTILEKYSIFLEKEGYTDTDWRAEPPTAIDKFMLNL